MSVMTLFVFIASFITLAEPGVVINYDVIYNSRASITKSEYILVASNSTSDFNYVNANSQAKAGQDVLKGNNKIFEGGLTVTKNYKSNKMLTLMPLVMKMRLVKEDAIGLQDWTIISDTSTVIEGYQCSIATCNFRGRNYTAAFTKDIGLSGGPYKFDGLPGMILSVESNDGFYSAKATEVKSGLVTPKGEFSNKDNLELTTWEEFSTQYRMYIQKYNAANASEEITFSIEMMEKLF